MAKNLRLTLILLVGDLLLTIFALWLTTHLRPALEWGKGVEHAGLPMPVYALTVCIWFTVFILQSTYHIEQLFRLRDETRNVITAVCLSILVFAGLLYFSYRDISRLQIVLFAALDLYFLLSFRLGIRVLFWKLKHKRREAIRVIIIGATEAGRDCAQRLKELDWMGLELVGFLDNKISSLVGGFPILGSFNHALAVIKEYHIHEVIFALPIHEHSKLLRLLNSIRDTHVNIRLVPDLVDLVFLQSKFENFRGMPLLTLKEPVLDPWQRLVKRLLDFAIAGLLLLIAAPLMALIGVAIRLDSKGPIFFKQERVGENGRLFTIFKFRSMSMGADQRLDFTKNAKPGQVIHKVENDPRVTRVGRLLRRTSLDELPQLINVIKGDMSLVGPRPEMPWLVDHYEAWQHKRFAVPQGITGWWQINGRSDKPMHLNTEYDLQYIQNYSLLLDMKILWDTIGAVLRGKGAY
jgi:exopolysaccharide biosynthesis polyprenyl glycosylphosphotransferase